MNNRHHDSPRRRGNQGFTLVELLVSCAITILIMAMITSITNIVAKTWKETTVKMEAFEGARSAFDRITNTLSQAVLNTYWDYDNPVNPTKYERCSELQFLTLPMNLLGANHAEKNFPTHALFFQAPTGLVTNKGTLGEMPFLLNAFGYFIEYGGDTLDRPSFLPSTISPRYRYRIKEWRVPSEKLALYGKSSGVAGKSYLGPQSLDWIDLANPAARPLAENVIALVAYPKNTENIDAAEVSLATTNFVYNSRNNGTQSTDLNQRHQLPPEVEIIMVAIDESSAVTAFKNAAESPGLAVGLFANSDPTKMEEDLKTLTDSLNNKRIRFIVLRSTVKIRGARWSQN